MSLEKVKEDIWNSAQKEAHQKKSKAKEQVEDMLKKAKESIKKFKEQEAKQLLQQKDDIEKREIASARLEARKKVLEFKKAELEETFSRAKQKLKELPEAKRKEYLSKLFEAAKTKIDIASLACSNKDKMFFKGVNIKEKEMTGGLIAENQDSTLQINFSYDSLLEVIRERNLAEIAEILFGNAKTKSQKRL